MMMVALIVVGAAWSLSLLSLALDLAGRPRGRSSRRRSTGGLVMCTGVLIDLLDPWPAHSWAFRLLGLLLVMAGAVCILASPVRAPRAKPPHWQAPGADG